MNKQALLVVAFTAIAFPVAAGPHSSVSSLPSSAAEKLGKDGNLSDGCGLYELPTELAASTETPEKYDAKELVAAAANMSAADRHAKAELQSVWSWCVTPSASVRVWSACKGNGDTRSCGVYAARMKDGKLESVYNHVTGWDAPTIEVIDSSKVPASLWVGSGLKVTAHTAAGVSKFAVYPVFTKTNDIAELKFTAEERSSAP